MRWNRVAVSVALLASLPLASSALAEPLPIGKPVPKFTFQDTRYLDRKLEEFGKRNGYVLFFTTVDCPMVQRLLPQIKELALKYRPHDIQFVAVNVGADDSILEIAAQDLEYLVGFPFVKDHRGEVASALGVDRTATVVVIDGQGKLHYRGRVDAQTRYGGATPREVREDLREALDDLVKQQPARVAETPIDGCLITEPTPVEPDPNLTYNRDIASIVEQHCGECHQRGAEAPFPLQDYRNVKSHASMIAEVVGQGRMPPWYAIQGKETFLDAPSLQPKERETLLAWLAGEQPEGDEADIPAQKRTRRAEWKIGKPDVIVPAIPSVRLPASGYIPYQYVVLPFQFTAETWVEAIEILPDNPKALHHAIMAGGSPDTLNSTQKLAAALNNFIAGYVPGGAAVDIPPGTALRIPAGTVLMVQCHYVATGKRTTDHIRVGFRFPRVPVKHELRTMVLHNSDFLIPPREEAYPVHEFRTFEQDAIGMGLFGHMHLRGRDMTFTAKFPNGDTEPLLTIPNYSFDWQMGYRWPPGTKRFPRGTRIDVLARYDNSEFNPNNPDPAQTVEFGLRSLDEMLYGLLFYINEDENLNLTIDPKTGQVVR